MPKAKVPSGPFVIVGAWFSVDQPAGCDTDDAVVLHDGGRRRPRCPWCHPTVMVPELVTGPLSESAGWPDVPVVATVSEPLFCRPDEMVKLGTAVGRPSDWRPWMRRHRW